MIARLLPLALLPTLTGCLFSGPMWRNANVPLVSEPSTFGVVEARPGSGNSAANAHGLLVVRYSINGSDSLYAAIPLAADGCPIEPFRYTGDKRRPVEIVEDLPESQRERLRQARLTLKDEAWAQRLAARPRFREVGWTTDGTSVPFDAGHSSGRRAESDFGRVPAIRVRALRLGRPFTPAERIGMTPPVGDWTVYPEDACVILLPYAQPRAHHRFNAQCRAALLTPVTLVGDAIWVPTLWVASHVFGHAGL